MRRGRNYLLLVVTMALWSSNLLIGDALVDRIDPVQLTWIRWCFSIPPLVVFAFALDGNRWRSGLREWPKHLLAALVGGVGYPLLAYWALELTTAIDVSIINSLNPVILVIAAGLIARERIGWRTYLGLFVSVVGVLVVVTRGNLVAIGAVQFNAGELVMLIAIFCWTGYSLWGRRLATPPSTSTALHATMAAVVLTPFALFGAGSGGAVEFRPVSLDGWGWLAVVFIAIFPSAMAFVFWNLAVRDLGGGEAGVFQTLIPVFTAIGSIAIGQPVTVAQWIGGAVVVVGLLLAVAPGRSRGAPPTTPAPPPLAAER